MRSCAVDKSAATGDTIYYAVFDGTDSHRLYRAYPKEFSGAARRKKRGSSTRR
jgi:hypothetical protein